MTGVRVNMSAEEASSAPKAASDPIPSGRYLCAITGCEEREVTSEPKAGKKDNRGKPYYNYEFTVQDGEYRDEMMYSNAMLFDGALYTISQILKALGVEVKENGWFQVDGYEECVVPEPGWFFGKQLVVYGKAEKGKVKDPKGDKNDPDNRYPDRTEPRAFWHANTWEGAPAAKTGTAVGNGSKAASLLP